MHQPKLVWSRKNLQACCNLRNVWTQKQILANYSIQHGIPVSVTTMTAKNKAPVSQLTTASCHVCYSKQGKCASFLPPIFTALMICTIIKAVCMWLLCVCILVTKNSPDTPIHAEKENTKNKRTFVTPHPEHFTHKEQKDICDTTSRTFYI